jgi:hypothetical protein
VVMRSVSAGGAERIPAQKLKLLSRPPARFSVSAGCPSIAQKKADCWMKYQLKVLGSWTLVTWGRYWSCSNLIRLVMAGGMLEVPYLKR